MITHLEALGPNIQLDWLKQPESGCGKLPFPLPIDPKEGQRKDRLMEIVEALREPAPEAAAEAAEPAPPIQTNDTSREE